jgi:hypothetical protein
MKEFWHLFLLKLRFDWEFLKHFWPSILILFIVFVTVILFLKWFKEGAKDGKSK